MPAIGIPRIVIPPIYGIDVEVATPPPTLGVVVSDIVGLIDGTPEILDGVPVGHTETILMDSTQPTFLAEVPTLRLVPPLGLAAKLNLKPILGSGMMSWMKPVIRDFWPFWENSGSAVADISSADSGTLVDTIGGKLSWDSAVSSDYGVGWPTDPQYSLNRNAITEAQHDARNVDVILDLPIVLTGGWSFDFCWRKPSDGSLWTHTLVTHDPVLGIVGYTMGKVNPNFATTSANDVGPVTNVTPLVPGTVFPTFTIRGLFQAIGYMNGGAIQLEYFRIWRRVLNLVEIQSLAADPFCMFGVTQETLDEIRSIINFMTPAKEGWEFVFTS